MSITDTSEITAQRLQAFCSEQQQIIAAFQAKAREFIAVEYGDPDSRQHADLLATAQDPDHIDIDEHGLTFTREFIYGGDSETEQLHIPVDFLTDRAAYDTRRSAERSAQAAKDARRAEEERQRLRAKEIEQLTRLQAKYPDHNQDH